MQARTLLAVAFASLAGCVVYLALIYLGASSAPPGAGRGLAMLSLPATLISALFVTFVLLPLWHVLQRSEVGRLLFPLAGSAAWLALTAALLFLTTWDPSEGLGIASQLMVPGLVVVLVFGAIARA